MNEDASLIKLVNPNFSFEFMGVVYEIRKATLDKAIQYQEKIKSLKDDSTADLKLVAFCIYIMLKSQIPELTEQIVMENVPADIDTLQTLSTLGFISPTKLALTKAIQNKIMSPSPSENSLQS
jgi:hypothetical protein